MANYTTRQAISMFEKLKVQNGTSNHHIKGFIIDDDGRKLFPPIYVSKGNKELPRHVEKNLAACLKLGPEHFRLLITCKMSRTEYLQIRT
jgi:hypothetical protein